MFITIYNNIYICILFGIKRIHNNLQESYIGIIVRYHLLIAMKFSQDRYHGNNFHFNKSELYFHCYSYSTLHLIEADHTLTNCS